MSVSPAVLKTAGMRRTSLTAALLLAIAGCGAHPVAVSTELPSAPSPSVGLPVVNDFGVACKLERVVCGGDAPASGPFPAALERPLALPSISPGAPCPLSPSARIATPRFGGIALGAGPARPLVAAPMDASHAIVLGVDRQAGWLSFKTLWFTEPSYQGPVRIRGARIDAPGAMAFGESPDLAELVIPPGPTVNERDGWREAPGGTFVKSPGCFAWQVDAIGFSTIITFLAVQG